MDAFVKRDAVELVEASSDYEVSSSSAYSSYSSESSESSYSAESKTEIKWVDRSEDSNFSYGVWKLGIFMCSEKKVGQNYCVKCLICEKRRFPCSGHSDTTAMAHHARSRHSRETQVAAWIQEQERVKHEKKDLKQAADEQAIKVSFHCSRFLADFLVESMYVNVFGLFAEYAGW